MSMRRNWQWPYKILHVPRKTYTDLFGSTSHKGFDRIVPYETTTKKEEEQIEEN